MPLAIKFEIYRWNPDVAGSKPHVQEYALF